MDAPSPHRITFYQLSVGLRIILVCILIGSCAGASDNSVTDNGASDVEVQQLSDEITSLQSEVRRLRREVLRLR